MDLRPDELMSTPLQDGDRAFVGMDSSVLPAELGGGQVSRSVNMISRGRSYQARPGFNCVFTFGGIGASDSSSSSPTTTVEINDPNFQGSKWFYPVVGAPLLVFAVSGTLYRSEHPYSEYETVGDFFDPSAPFCFFEQALQTAERNIDGSIQLIDPRAVLIVQDGRKTPPVVFDGQTASQQRGAGAIPHGSTMKWVGDRLWVAQGPKLIPSDIGNPVSFFEPIDTTVPILVYLVMKGDITALSLLPGRSDQLLAFTSSNAEVVQAGVRSRPSWLAIENFQQEILTKIGCVAHRSVAEHHGLLWWYSQYGLVNFDVARQAQMSSVLPYQDNEMLWQKGQLANDLSGIASATYENFFLLSVPVATLDNSFTWVLDQSTRITKDGVLSGWTSCWNGLRPAEWVSLESEQQPRLFCFDQQDGELRLWEAFGDEQLDEGCPFEWWMESRGYDGDLLLNDKEARYVRVDLVELKGTTDIAVFWGGENRGHYRRIATKRYEAQQDVFAPGQIYTPISPAWRTKPQSRRLITEEIKAPRDLGCSVESAMLPYQDEAFQILIVGQGPGGVRALRLQLGAVEGQNKAGQCSTDEAPNRMVRSDGVSLQGTADEILLAENDTPMLGYTAQSTQIVSRDEISSVGSAPGFSIISQATADRQAQVTATRIASRALETTLLPIVSFDNVVY